MKNIFIFMFIVILTWGSLSWAEEAVTGRYDVENDWFVYEWKNPNSGTVSTIDDFPNKVTPYIDGHVSYNYQENDYVYSYTITNTGGKQVLYKIIVQIISDVYQVSAPSREWHSNWKKVTTKNAWKWAKTRPNDGVFGIAVSKTESGFMMKSRGVPAILNASFYGKRRRQISPPGDYDSYEANESFWKVYREFKKQYPEKFETVKRKTVAPGPIPDLSNPVSFIDNIISMKHEAADLGWITNQGIVISLDQKLDAAKQKLAQGNTRAAKNILNAFIKEVEAQGCESHEKCPKGKHILPEAYALLKYNAKYLVDNLE